MSFLWYTSLCFPSLELLVYSVALPGCNYLTVFVVLMCDVVFGHLTLMNFLGHLLRKVPFFFLSCSLVFVFFPYMRTVLYIYLYLICYLRAESLKFCFHNVYTNMTCVSIKFLCLLFDVLDVLKKNSKFVYPVLV